MSEIVSNMVLKLNYLFYLIYIFPAIPAYANPCQPSPCGPNSQCREINQQAVCSCLPSFVGSSPGCRPECVLSTECSPIQACVNQKCIDPCPGVCGINSNCKVRNHSPICVCNNGYSGDPFTRCILIPRKKIITTLVIEWTLKYFNYSDS